MLLDEAKEKLAKFGQEHVLKYYEELNDEEKTALLEQIEDTDFSILSKYSELGKASKRG